MATYILLTKVSPESMTAPAKLTELEEAVKKKIKKRTTHRGRTKRKARHKKK